MPLTAVSKFCASIAIVQALTMTGCTVGLMDTFTEPALVPASPWLSKTRPAKPVVRLGADAATGEQSLRLTPGDRRLVMWWTVRALQGSEWKTWILPGSQRRLIVAPRGAAEVSRVIVTAVDRYGTESSEVQLSR